MKRYRYDNIDELELAFLKPIELEDINIDEIIELNGVFGSILNKKYDETYNLIKFVGKIDDKLVFKDDCDDFLILNEDKVGDVFLIFEKDTVKLIKFNISIEQLNHIKKRLTINYGSRKINITHLVKKEEITIEDLEPLVKKEEEEIQKEKEEEEQEAEERAKKREEETKRAEEEKKNWSEKGIFKRENLEVEKNVLKYKDIKITTKKNIKEWNFLK